MGIYWSWSNRLGGKKEEEKLYLEWRGRNACCLQPCIWREAKKWRKLGAEKLMLLNCGVGEDSWESLGLQGDPISSSWRKSVLGVHWKDWCWSWNSSTLATSCEQLTHWKRPWCWEGLGAGGEGDDRGWDGWMASPTQWTWVWVNSRSWWWTGRPGVLRFMGSQRVRHDWATELNWAELNWRTLEKATSWVPDWYCLLTAATEHQRMASPTHIFSTLASIK